MATESGLSIPKIAQGIGQREKTVHYAIQLYKLYPDLNSLPEGKAISWYKVTKTLPAYEKVSSKKERKNQSK